MFKIFLNSSRLFFLLFVSALLLGSFSACEKENQVNAEKIKQIELKMSIEEVRAQLGEPTRKLRIKTVHAWEYEFNEGFGVVSFELDQVKAVSLNGQFIAHVDMQE